MTFYTLCLLERENIHIPVYWLFKMDAQFPILHVRWLIIDFCYRMTCVSYFPHIYIHIFLLVFAPHKKYCLLQVVCFLFFCVQVPIALLLSQLPKQSNDSSGLLKFSEVVSLFHEFGHVVGWCFFLSSRYHCLLQS